MRWIGLWLALLAGTAQAQAPVTLVVNFAAGGPTDITARLLAPELTAALGAQVVVKTVAGASGTIGAAEVARARPDGQTLLFSPVGPLAIQPHFQARIPYRAADFAPVCQVTETPVVMMTPGNSGLRTLTDVAARARGEAGGMPYASTGPGTLPHIAMVAWTRAAGLDMVHVPFRGAGEVMVAFQQGSVAVFSDQPAVIRQHGLHAIAVFAPERTPELPGVPTMRELGHDLRYTIWQGLFAPAGLAPPLLARLEAACAAAVRTPAVIDGLARIQMPLVVRDAPGLAAFLAVESEKFAALIEATGMRRAE